MGCCGALCYVNVLCIMLADDQHTSPYGILWIFQLTFTGSLSHIHLNHMHSKSSLLARKCGLAALFVERDGVKHACRSTMGQLLLHLPLTQNLEIVRASVQETSGQRCWRLVSTAGFAVHLNW